MSADSVLYGSLLDDGFKQKRVLPRWPFRAFVNSHNRTGITKLICTDVWHMISKSSNKHLLGEEKC